jgi:hypothetical protein
MEATRAVKHQYLIQTGDWQEEAAPCILLYP